MREKIKLESLKSFLKKNNLTIDMFEKFIMNGQTIEELILKGEEE